MSDAAPHLDARTIPAAALRAFQKRCRGATALQKAHRLHKPSIPRSQTLFGNALAGETLFRVEGVSAGDGARPPAGRSPA